MFFMPPQVLMAQPYVEHCRHYYFQTNTDVRQQRMQANLQA